MKNKRTPMVLGLTAGALLAAASGCGNPSFDENGRPLAFGELQSEIRGGTEQNGHVGVVQLNGCTGSMIGPTIIVTSAHCFTESGPRSLSIRYFEPGLPAGSPRSLGFLSVSVTKHPSFDPDHLYPPSRANHDIALVQLTSAARWPETDYHDYLRVFSGTTVSHLDLYGAGKNGDDGGSGILRWRRFEVEDTLRNRLELDTTLTKSACADDSGAPYIVRGTGIISCVHSRSDRVFGDCLGDDATEFFNDNQYCTKVNNSVNFTTFLQNNSATSCEYFDQNGSHAYRRCFEIPYINDVPGEGLEQDLAVAIVSAAML